MTPSIAQILTTTDAQPFCDTRYKAIRVLGQCIGRTLYASALLAVAVVSRIFDEPLASMYYSHAKIQFARGWTTSWVYREFVEKVINFSFNGCIATPSATTEETALRNYYGSDVIDQWLRIRTKEIKVKGIELKRLDGRGVCAGMTIDFCSRYCAQVNMDVSPVEAVRKISAHYATGAPKAAQLAQVFLNALWDVNQRSLQKASILENTISALKCKAIIRSRFGLRTNSIDLHTSVISPNTNNVELILFLGKLSPGCYDVIIRGSIGHSVVVIKVSNAQYYLFDPSFCTLVCKNVFDIAEAISKSATHVNENILSLICSRISAASQEDCDKEISQIGLLYIMARASPGPSDEKDLTV